MNLLDKIRKQQRDVRKELYKLRGRGDGGPELEVESVILTVLLGEAEKLGKVKENRTPSDSEVIGIIRKLIKTTNEVKEHVRNDPAKVATAEIELKVLEGLLPKQLSEDEIVASVKETIEDLGATTMKQMGQVMGALKKKHGDSLDMALASKKVKEILS